MRRDPKLKALYEQKITNSKKGAPINERDKAIFERLVHNEMQYIKEDTFSSDISRVGETLIPVFRRAFPQLIGKDLVGVQPMSQPSGHVFSMRYNYKGNAGVGVHGNSGNIFVNGNGQNNGAVGPNGQAQVMSKPDSVVVIYSDRAALEADIPLASGQVYPAAGAAYDATIQSTVTAAASATSFVMYVEDNKALMYVPSADVSSVLGANYGSGSEATWNTAGYNYYFKNYVGPWTTDIAERKGDDIEEVGMMIEKVLVEAVSRKLRSSYTLESAQDMKSIHGKDIASELIDVLQFLVSQGVDRDLLDAIAAAAIPAPAYDLNADSDGRWSIENYRNAYTQLIRQSNSIAKTTLRGPGNFVVASPDVCTMLETIPSYQFAPIKGGGDVDTSVNMNQMGNAMIGSLGGRFNVYRDIFKETNETIIGYKGPSEFDSGIIWSPYRPIEMTKVIQQETGNPRIIFTERSAISFSAFTSDGFFRKINFENIF